MSARCCWDVSFLLFFVTSTVVCGQTNEADARRAAAENWRQVEPWWLSATRHHAELLKAPRDEVARQLAAATPDWVTVRRLDALFAEAALRLEDPRFDRFRHAWNCWFQRLEVPTVDQIAVWVADAMTRNASVSADELELARLRFEEDLGRFENRLQGWSGSRGWQDYLKVKDLKDVIRNGNSLRSAWSSVDRAAERWRVAALLTTAGELQRATQSLAKLSCRARVAADPGFVETRRGHLARLSVLLRDQDRFQNGLPPREVAEICHWLAEREIDRHVVDAIEKRFVFPNLVIRIPQSLLAAEFDRELTDDFPVDDVIVGTRVCGHGRLVGQLNGRFQPSVDRGLLDVSLQGQTVASTVGYNGGVRVSSTAVTQLQGNKRLVVNPGGIHPFPATFDARTRITYDGLDVSNIRFGRLARSRVYATRRMAEKESADKAASHAGSTLDDAVGVAVSSFNSALRGQILLPLASQEVWPRTHSIRSDSSGLVMALLQKTPSHFGAPGPPPGDTSSEPQVLIHASFVEQLVTELAQGKTIPGEKVLCRPQPQVNTDPPSDAGDPWSLSFDETAPISVAFLDDGVHITVRLAGFHANQRDFSGVEMSIQCRLVQRDAQWVLRREGDFAIFPVDFVRGEQRLSGPQLAMRDALRRKLEAHVPRDFHLQDLLVLNPTTTGTLTKCFLTEGWLCLTIGPASP